MTMKTNDSVSMLLLSLSLFYLALLKFVKFPEEKNQQTRQSH